MQKDKDPNFRYQVRLGKENLELFIKQLDDSEYTEVQLDLFGSYIKPDLSKFNVQSSLNISPPKGRTMKRAWESPGTTRNPSKRQVVRLDNLTLQPSWRMSEKSDGPATTNSNTENNLNNQVTIEDFIDDLEDSLYSTVNK